MYFLLDVLLHAMPVLVLVLCVVWIVRLRISQDKGERMSYKWKDIGPRQKALVFFVVAWLFLNLYLSVGNELAFLNVVVLPLSSLYTDYSLAETWSAAIAIVCLVSFFYLRAPRRVVAASA